MSDPVQKMLDMGAQSVAGDLMFKNKVLGTSRNGVFSITPEGEEFLAIDDAPVKQDAPKAPTAPKAKKAEKTKPAEVTPAPEPAPAPTGDEDLAGDLDNLLA